MATKKAKKRDTSKDTSTAGYLRDLADRLGHVPVAFGVDQGDSDRLYSIADGMEP